MSALIRLSAPLRLALLALSLYLLPCLLLGPRGYVTIDDNLDSELTAPYLLPRLGVALDYRPTTLLAPIMNGLPRNAVRPGLSATVGLFGLLAPLPAYWLHQLLVRLLGLLGLYALARAYWLRGSARRPLAALLALAWATLPLYTIYGLSVAGQPWVLLALLNLRAGCRHWWSWAVLAAFPLWSSFVFVGPFLLATTVGGLLWDARPGGRPRHWRAVLAGLGVLLLSYLVVEYPLFYSLLTRQYVSHRVEFDLSRLVPISFWGSVKSAGQYFLLGQYHAGLFFRGVPLVAAGLALGTGPRARRQAAKWRLGPLLAVLVVVAVFCGFYPPLVRLLQPVVPALRTFNVSRFHFLTPLLWFVVLGLSLAYLPSRRWRLALVAAQLLVGLACNAEWTTNLRTLAGRARPTEPGYAAYVAPSLFGKLQTLLYERTGLAPAGYRVACLGLPPTVAQLNGFYTLDSYQNNYPLRYKHQFRPLIAGELAKSPPLRAYFDYWGNRCYLFSAELGKDFRVGAFQHRVVQHWAFDAAAFRRLGGRFVLSAARLARPAESGLRLVAVVTDSRAYWALYVYEVAPSTSPPPTQNTPGNT